MRDLFISLCALVVGMVIQIVVEEIGAYMGRNRKGE